MADFDIGPSPPGHGLFLRSGGLKNKDATLMK